MSFWPTARNVKSFLTGPLGPGRKYLCHSGRRCIPLRAALGFDSAGSQMPRCAPSSRLALAGRGMSTTPQNGNLCLRGPLVDDRGAGVLRVLRNTRRFRARPHDAMQDLHRNCGKPCGKMSPWQRVHRANRGLLAVCTIVVRQACCDPASARGRPLYCTVLVRLRALAIGRRAPCVHCSNTITHASDHTHRGTPDS